MNDGKGQEDIIWHEVVLDVIEQGVFDCIKNDKTSKVSVEFLMEKMFANYKGSDGQNKATLGAIIRNNDKDGDGQICFKGTSISTTT